MKLKNRSFGVNLVCYLCLYKLPLIIFHKDLELDSQEESRWLKYFVVVVCSQNVGANCFWVFFKRACCRSQTLATIITTHRTSVQLKHSDSSCFRNFVHSFFFFSFFFRICTISVLSCGRLPDLHTQIWWRGSTHHFYIFSNFERIYFSFSLWLPTFFIYLFFFIVSQLSACLALPSPSKVFFVCLFRFMGFNTLLSPAGGS